MKVALYYPWVYLKSGCERTIAAVIRHSRHDWTIYTNRFDRDATFPELSDAHIVELARVPVDRSFLHVARAGWTIGRQVLPLDGERALVVFCEGLGDLATFRASVPALCVCLTPLRAAFDPHYQERYLALRGRSRLRAGMLTAAGAAFRAIDRRAWRNYRHVIAISREVASRIDAGRLLAPGCSLEVAYPGVEVGQMQPSWTSARYILLPGRIMWTKNIELAIDAFLRVRQRAGAADLRLVVAGFVDEKSRSYIARLREMAGTGQGVEFVVSPDDTTLQELYRNAYAIAYPPVNEDWGLVPLEAMAYGKPVVAVDGGGPRETVRHNETGFLVPPDADRFADALHALATSPELVRRMGQAATRRAAEFDMARFVDVLDARVEHVVSSSSTSSCTSSSRRPRW